MSSQSRREKEKQELRSKIFDAATQIILEEGYENLSMRKVAGRIDYSPTVIYHYFRDKADIVHQIILENDRVCMKAVKDVLEEVRDQSAEVRFRRAAVCLVVTMSMHAPQFRAVVLSGGDMAAPAPEGGNEGLHITERILQEGIREGVFHHVTPFTAQIITSALFGLVFHLTGHGITDAEIVEEMAQECVSILIKGCL